MLANNSQNCRYVLWYVFILWYLTTYSTWIHTIYFIRIQNTFLNSLYILFTKLIISGNEHKINLEQEKMRNFAHFNHDYAYFKIILSQFNYCDIIYASMYSFLEKKI